MGAWGVGLYDNDIASDLRDAYNALLVAVLRVVQSYTAKMGAVFPIVELLAWKSEEEPTPEQIRQLPVATVPDGSFSLHGGDWEDHVERLRTKGLVPNDITVHEYLESYRSPVLPVRKSRATDPEFKRVEILDLKVDFLRKYSLVHSEIAGPETDWTWKRLDEKLARCFRI